MCLQRFAGDDKSPLDLSVFVSLTRSGIPRIIPSFHREMICKGNSDIVRLYMSLFSVTKLIELASKVTADTFSSVTTPVDLDSVVLVVSEMKPLIRHLIDRYIPDIRRIPLQEGLRFLPTWKTVPTSAWYTRLLRNSSDDSGKPLRALAKKSIFLSLPYELSAFQFLMTFVHSS